MTRARLEKISRFLSAAEWEARRVRASAKLVDCIAEAQLACGERLARDEPHVPLSAERVTAIRKRLLAHLRAAGVGSTQRLIERTQLDATALYGFKQGSRCEDWFVTTVERFLDEADQVAAQRAASEGSA